jgi:predicted DNA-binding protein YlxM (UPF0122 family)
MRYDRISKEFLIEEYQIKKKSAKTISLELNCGETTVFRALEHYGIRRRTSKENQNPLYGKEPTKEDLIELHYNKHLSINKIAEIHHTSWGNIKRLFNKYGIKTKSHDEIIRPKDYIEPNKEQLMKWYYDENLTTENIGKILGVTSSSIKKLLIKNNISSKKIIKDRKPKGYWTRERVIEEIKEIHRNKQELSARYCSKNRGKLFKAALKFFDNKWENAITEAGFDYNLIRKQKRWKKEEILKEIKKMTSSAH